MPQMSHAMRRCQRRSTFLMRVAMLDFLSLLYMRALSAVRCLLREFCLASTKKVTRPEGAAEPAETGATAEMAAESVGEGL